MSLRHDNPVRFYTLLALTAWTLVVFALYAWVVYDNHSQALEMAQQAALTNIRKDLAIRRWAAAHGGVYVPPDATTPPNPYLDVPERDVVTTGGKRLTLMNPAYVIRQLQQQFEAGLGVKGHLTSLKLLNPDNAPDPWEKSALEAFERGEEQRSSVDTLDGKSHMRVMQAVRVEPDCLKCHAKQGYKLGEVRGGISASVELTPYLAHSWQESLQLLVSHSALLLLGYSGIGFFNRRARREAAQRQGYEQSLLEERAGLKAQVEEQTRDLQQALTEAKSAERAKDEFIANMSHEMRTPLNAIVGLSYLAAQRESDAKSRDYLTKISDAGSSLQLIIDDLIDISKLASDRLQLDTAPFSLKQLLSRQVASCRDKAAEKGLAFSFEAAPDLPDRLLGDPRRLNQVLTKLSGNAIKFTAQGSVALAVRRESSSGTKELLRFSIRDTGQGMAREALSRIFRPFTQADSSTTRNFGGTGLGLAICSRLIGLMGGEIAVDSEPGRGSCFSFTVSFQRDPSPPLAEVEEKSNFQARLSFQNVRVLVAEDQPLNQAIVKEMLEQVGIEVDLADNGQLAVERLTALPADYYDAVLMDIQMPVMDGIAATETLRRKPGLGQLPVIALSAYTMAHERAKFFAAGLSDHIGKPFQAADLYATLARWVAPAKCRYLVEAQAPQKADADAAVASALDQLRDIDGADGLMRFGGKLPHYLRWLRIFAEEAPKAVADIEAALHQGDIEAAQKLVHGFKGRTGMLGMVALHQATVELEAALRRGDAAIDSDSWQATYQRTHGSLLEWLSAQAFENDPA